MKRKLTQSMIASIPAPEKRTDYRDSAAQGLVLRVEPSGKKSWYLDYKFEGKRKWWFIGHAEYVSLSEARREAQAFHREPKERRGDGQGVEAVFYALRRPAGGKPYARRYGAVAARDAREAETEGRHAEPRSDILDGYAELGREAQANFIESAGGAGPSEGDGFKEELAFPVEG